MIGGVDWYSDGWGARLGLIALGLILLAILISGAKKCPPVARLMRMALAWHLIVFSYNIFWALPYYGTGSDGWSYHNTGIRIASLIRAGSWGDLNWGLSTAATYLVTGFLYTPFGADVFGITFFSAVLGMGGAIYLCRAFSCWATPKQTRTYALLVLFLPSYVMWSGIFGKDSWIAFGLGLAAYGYSAMQQSGNSKGLWHLFLGLTVTGIIRPHIALVVTAAMAIAYIWCLTKNMRGSAPMKLVRIVVLVTMVAVLYPLTLNFIGLGADASADNVEQYMQTGSDANAKAGGSVVNVQIAPGVAGIVRAFPRGVVRILLEPFPWEVHNVNAALAAVENLFIAWFLFSYARRVRELIRGVVREPYLLFSAFLALGLMVFLLFVPNLGLLSRQRIQLLPFLFAVLVGVRVERKRRADPVPVLAPQSQPPAFAGRQLVG